MKQSDINIGSLVYSVSEDDRNAFNKFYNIYYGEVFRLAYYFLKDKKACHEVVVNVFFSIWQSRRKLKEIKNIESYLYITIKNEANRYITKNSSEHTVSLEEITFQLPDSPASSPEDDLLNKEIEQLLSQAINKLPEKCRIIFLMTRDKGLKPKEIAGILKINESTVRVQMKIAIEKILHDICPHFPDLTLTVLLINLLSL